jgi:hypothetical protein
MTSRRTFLVTGLAGGAALAFAWWWRERPAPASVVAAQQPLAALDREAPAIVAAIVPVILAGALPDEPAARRSAIDETVAGVARAIAGLPPATQKELGELFALLGFAPARLLAARVASHWSAASADDVAAFLERWRTSDIALLRSAYDALHQLVLAAWYGNPRAWPAIGYAGPPKLGP